MYHIKNMLLSLAKFIPTRAHTVWKAESPASEGLGPQVHCVYAFWSFQLLQICEYTVHIHLQYQLK